MDDADHEGQQGQLPGMADVVSPTVPRWFDRNMEAFNAITGEDAPELVFVHSILAQCVLPLRDPATASYERRVGRAHMRLTTGQSFDRNAGRYVDSPGLPYGAKARLILLHICREALAQDTTEVHVADNMTAFMRQLGLAVTGGRNGSIAGFKSQLHRLATTRLSLNFENADADKGHGAELEQVTEHNLFANYTLWLPDGQGRGLQGSTVRLSDGFFADLKLHSVPLNMTAIRALSNSARALDLYTWLAYRLHKVKRANGERITWKALQAQFGNPDGDLKSFKRRFRSALAQALGVYPDAFNAVDIVADGRRSGLHIRHAEPPIAYRTTAAKRVTGKR